MSKADVIKTEVMKAVAEQRVIFNQLYGCNLTNNEYFQEYLIMSKKINDILERIKNS